MFFFAEFLDAMAHPLHEANGDTRVAIDDGVEAVARNFQENGIVEGADAGPLRLAAEQWHLAEAIAVAVGGEDAFTTALKPRVRLEPTGDDCVECIARIIFAHHQIALFDSDKLRALSQAVHQLPAETGQKWHIFKYLQFVVHRSLSIGTDPVRPRFKL